MKTTPDLEPITVTASRVLRDGSPDPCADPAYAGTQYCRTRLVDVSGTPESPGEWNARKLRESSGVLDVTVTRGRQAAVTAPATLGGVSTWVWVAGLVMVLALLGQGRYDRH